MDSALILATILRSHLAIQNLQKFKESVRLYKMVYQCCSEAVVVTDASNTIVDANPAFVALSGYRIDELVGKNPSILKSGRQPTPFYEAMWQSVKSTGKWRGELWNRNKSGNLYAQELSIKTIFNPDGTVWRHIGMIVDRTVHKQEAQALLESDMRWQFALECHGEAMWDWNLTTHAVFTTVAAAAILGLSSSTRHHQMSDLLTGVIAEDFPKVQAAVNQLLAGKSSELQIEFRISSLGKETRWISTRGRVMTRNERGMPERVVSVCKDITQEHIKKYEYRNQTELLAQQARLVLIGEMASIFAHEINQPLTAMSALAAACRRKLSNEAQARSLLDAIEEQALRGGDIAWRILGFAKRQRSGRRAISLAQIVAKIPGWIRLQHSRSEIFIQIVDVNDNLPPIYAAPVEIEQVLLNLVRNAIDAGVANSKVQRVAISALLDTQLGHIEVQVTDWGCGFPDYELFAKAKLFESGKEHGAGLGLTVCISIVQAHGGRIWATANPEGGTIVHFTLPLYDHQLHQTLQNEHTLPPPEATSEPQ